MTIRFLLPALFFLGSTVQGQYAIPDPELVLELQAVVPAAMSGNLLDTTHPSVLDLNFLDLGLSDVTNLDGVQFFTGLDSLSVRFTPLLVLTNLPSNLKWLDCTYADLIAIPNDLPTGLEYLNCSYLDLTSLPTTWPSALVHLVASSNELTITTTLPPSLQFLDLSSNELVSIQSLPAGLTELRLQGNNLTSLPALPSGLITLHAPVNNLTALPALPLGLEYLVLSYNALTSLPQLPESLIELYVPSNQLTSLPELPTSLIKLSASSNLFTALPALPDNMDFLSFGWNQITSLPALPSAMTHLAGSGNQLTELPPLPNGLEELYCNQNPITCLPALPNSLVDLVCHTSQITCLPNMPTNLIADAGDLGFAPLICSPEDDCFLQQTITGVLFSDLDGDGLKGSTEPIRSHGSVEALPGPYLGGADSQGRFAIPVDPGTYSVQGQQVLYHSITTAPFDVTIAAGTSDTTSYIGYQPIPGIHDLVVDIQAGVARPGFENLVYVSVTNNGTEISEADINLYIADVQSYVTSTEEPWFQSETVVYWYAELAPGDSWSSIVTLYTDTSVALGTGFEHQFNANSAETDTVPVNNYGKWNDEVVGAYDPNDKRPSARSLTPEEVESGEWLGYTIRFQNTGSFLAENVVITDTLSSLLQWNTITYVSASHDAQWVLHDGVLTFSFNNIQLPDSGSDLIGSQGYIHFRVKVDPTLTLGDSIVNRANIYFDFNEPVITEPAVTRIEAFTGIHSLASTGPEQLLLAPNPASDQVVLSHSIALGRTGQLTLFDATGKVVHRSTVQGGTKSSRLNTTDLRPGMYHAVLTVGTERIGTGKLSVVR